ncbi:MAG: class I SAM-dependent methyltransferase [Candidatus Zixiibacteriota bacterium]|nr:MAG: class I SAM-dependent methyltransferase [candidate division Zixibacteria bacterium]
MNRRLKNHIEHYKTDGEEFDYFHVENPAIREEERRRMQLLTRAVDFKSGQSVLDAGSGNGWISNAFLDKDVFVCAVDLSLKNLKGIRDRFDAQKKGGYIVADLYRLPFKDTAFRGATSNDVYEHLEFPEKAAVELRRVLKKGAEVFVSTPYKENIVYYLCIHCNKKTPVNAHLHSFDEESLGRLFAESNFRIDSVTKFINRGLSILLVYYLFCRWMPYWLWRFIDKMANAIIRKPGRIGLRLVAIGGTD